ncbi:MAG: hypothetical protein L0Z70_11125 [Chloroflexi bacterium]|nr:hypothetical protein [Chloroflexota bacterium]
MEEVKPARAEPRWLLAILIALTLALTVWSEWGRMGDRYQVVQDVQNSYWMARFRNPDLFPQDYFLGERLVEVNLLGRQVVLYPRSLGYGLLFYLVNPLFDHIWFSKWLVFALTPLSVAWLYWIGKRQKDGWAGFSLGMLFVFFVLASYDSIALSSGLQRAFYLPLIIAFLLAMLQRRYTWACACMAASALIYWPVLPLQGITYGLGFFDKPRQEFMKRFVPLSLALIVVGALFFYEISIEYRLFLPGQVIAAQDPHFQAQGVMSLFVVFPLVGRAGLVMSGTDALNLLVLILLCLLVYKTLGRESLRRTPRLVWQLCAAGLMMYAAALVVLFGFSSTFLYLPSRYTQGTLFIACLIYLGVNWVDFMSALPGWLRQKRKKLGLVVAAGALALVVSALFLGKYIPLQPLFWLGGLILAGLAAVAGGSLVFGQLWSRQERWSASWLVGLALVVLASAASGATYARILGVEMVNPSQEQRAAYEYAGSLPVDALLAGDPEILSGIPLFSERMVLYRKLTPRRREGPLVVEYFNALYQGETGAMAEFCQAHALSHVVVNRDSFTSEYRQRGEYFYEPYNQQIRANTAGDEDFALEKLTPVFNSGKYAVYACSQMAR